MTAFFPMAVPQNDPNQVRDVCGEGSSREMLTRRHHIRRGGGVKVMPDMVAGCRYSVAVNRQPATDNPTDDNRHIERLTFSITPARAAAASYAP
jgi:hypothetical protein